MARRRPGAHSRAELVRTPWTEVARGHLLAAVVLGALVGALVLLLAAGDLRYRDAPRGTAVVLDVEKVGEGRFGCDRLRLTVAVESHVGPVERCVSDRPRAGDTLLVRWLPEDPGATLRADSNLLDLRDALRYAAAATAGFAALFLPWGVLSELRERRRDTREDARRGDPPSGAAPDPPSEPPSDPPSG